MLLMVVMLVMALLAAAMIVGPLLTRNAEDIAQQDISRNSVNSSVFQDRVKEIELDLATATISQEEFEQLKIELEIGLLGDVPSDDSGVDSAARVTSGVIATIAVFIIIPLMSYGFYYHEENNAAVHNWLELREEMAPVLVDLLAGNKPETGTSTRTLLEFVTALQREAQENPDDANIWHMLGMGYLQMQAGEQSEKALRHAYRIQPGNPTYQMALAQVLIELAEGGVTQESETLLINVLRNDQNNMQALAMLGMAEFYSGRFEQSLMYWEQLLAVSTQSNMPQEKIDVLHRSIAAAKKRIAGEVDSPAAAIQIQVTVDIDPALRSMLNPKDTLFVYAQHADGPKMPLAAIKTTVEALPLNVILGDEQAVTPQFRLSMASNVIVKARVSPSNNAIPVSGDLIGQSSVIDLHGESASTRSVIINIDALVP
ncbi:MAG: c-type cytochrome biogenesis protein CcmI [Moraxellaceae bacterium]|nr:MAG: c-type cytochrome biogenesis protein CcmI [Moraxellaceae bacterium]